MVPPERARKRIDFFNAYRSYIINYSLGMDMVRSYVDRQVAARVGGRAGVSTRDTEERGQHMEEHEGTALALSDEREALKIRWKEFERLLCEPWVPSLLL